MPIPTNTSHGLRVCQEFYKDLLKDDYRLERFRFLAKKEGMPEAKIEKVLVKGNGVPPRSVASFLIG